MTAIELPLWTISLFDVGPENTVGRRYSTVIAVYSASGGGCVFGQGAIDKIHGAVPGVANPAAAAAGRIVTEFTVGYRADGVTIVHQAAAVGAGMISREIAIDYGRAAVFIVHSAAMQGCPIVVKGAIDDRRAAGGVEHAAAAFLEIGRTVGIAAGNCKAFDDGIGTFTVYALDDMLCAVTVDYHGTGAVDCQQMYRLAH